MPGRGEATKWAPSQHASHEAHRLAPHQPAHADPGMATPTQHPTPHTARQSKQRPASGNCPVKTRALDTTRCCKRVRGPDPSTRDARQADAFILGADSVGASPALSWGSNL